MLQFFSNALSKILVASDNDPLPVVLTVQTVAYDPGQPISEQNPLPVVAS